MIASNKINTSSQKVALIDEELIKSKHARKISISKSIQHLPIGAFSKFNKLIKVYIDPNTQIKKIPGYCFANCTSLSNIKLPASIISIEEKAFLNCVSIKELIIPKTVLYIDNTAFEGWTANQTIFVYKEIKTGLTCKANVIVLEDSGEASAQKPQIVTKESEDSIKRYLVTAKCGHVGRMYYIPIVFPVQATSKKEAAKIVRNMGRVKHDHKDAILGVISVDETEYNKQVEINKDDPYLKVNSRHKQKDIQDVIDQRKVLDPHYKSIKKQEID